MIKAELSRKDRYEAKNSGTYLRIFPSQSKDDLYGKLIAGARQVYAAQTLRRSVKP